MLTKAEWCRTSIGLGLGLGLLREVVEHVDEGGVVSHLHHDGKLRDALRCLHEALDVLGYIARYIGSQMHAHRERMGDGGRSHTFEKISAITAAMGSTVADGDGGCSAWPTAELSSASCREGCEAVGKYFYY